MLLAILNNHIYLTISNSSASYARNHFNFSSDVDLHYIIDKYTNKAFLLVLHPKHQ